MRCREMEHGVIASGKDAGKEEPVMEWEMKAACGDANG